MKRKPKSYTRPKRPFEKERIEEEKKIQKEFGLKNKKEIWKAESEINSIREKAKALISSPEEEQKKLFERLNKQGYDVNSIADILSLNKTDLLKRRIQKIIHYKGFARSPRHARQLVAHKKVKVNGRTINQPSFHVPIELEDKIEIKEKPKKQSVKEEKPVEENQEEVNTEEKTKE